jgi:hypothetical protein
MDSLELARTTATPIGAAGAAYYFDPTTRAKGKALGLDGFRFYFLGRGGVLGNVEPAVVVSAFGYFNAPIVEAMWTSAAEIMEPRAAAKAYLEAANDFGRAHLSAVESLDAFNEAAEAVIATVDRSALALFAGIAAEPLPDDAPARAYRNVVTLRELRGCVHLVAIVAAGLPAAVAHAIRRPGDVEMFGYGEPPTITDADRAKLNEADVRTDQLMAAKFDVLDDHQRAALAAGATAIAAAIAG